MQKTRIVFIAVLCCSFFFGGSSDLLAQERSPKIIADRLNGNWLSDSLFSYSIVDANGDRRFTVVDAATGQRSSGASIEDAISRSSIVYDAQDATKKPPIPILPSSDESNDRVTVRFQNKTETGVELFWNPASGEPRAYQKVAPGETIEQSTFTNHSWFAVDTNGVPVWTAVVSSDRQIFTIEKMEILPRRSSRRGREGRRGRDRRSQSNATQAWDTRVEEHNLIFASREGKNAFSTTEVDGFKGTPDCPYESRVLWSPDNEKSILFQTTPGSAYKLTLVESSPADQLQPKIKQQPYAKPGDPLDQSKLRVAIPAAGKLFSVDESLYQNAWSLDEFRWESDSKAFTFVYNQRGHQILRLIRVDATSGEAKVLIEDKSTTYIDYAHKAFRYYVESTNEVIWGSERDGWYHLYRYDLTTGELKNQITRGEWCIRSIEKVDEENKQIWFYAGGVHAVQDPYHRHLCRVDFDGTNFTVLTEGDGDHEVTFSPNGKYLIDRYSRVDLPPVHELRSSENGSLIAKLEAARIDALLATGWTMPERFVAKGRDGKTDIFGIIIRPKVIDPTKKYAVVEDIYAGPQGAFVPKGFGEYREWHKLAELGFIVVKIDGMGTSYRSKSFHDVSYKNLKDGGFPDRILWLRAAAANYPEIDIDRVGIYGGSAGGQNAMAALLFFGDFYDAAVADCGCHDNRIDKIWWNELYMGWPIGPHYEENSNVVHAKNLRGKLFLVVGELDSNVDPASTLQVVNALVRADKDFDLLVVPGGGHGIGSSPYGVRRRNAFFLEHLGAPTSR